MGEPWRNLPGKVVMVTGASSGIGLEFCLHLANSGCKLIVSARRLHRLTSLCNQINHTGAPTRAVPVQLDISSDGDSIDAAVQTAWDAFGRIDALINNAGVRGTVKSPLDLTEDEWNSTIRTNLTGTWLVSKSVGRRMCDANIGGSIINVSSVSGLNRGFLPGGIAYVASKSAVNYITKVMALELGAYKIRVNAISPGIFKSEITEALLQKDWIHSVAHKIVPLRHHGTTDPALTSLVKYLIHDSSEYVTGNIYIVESGVTLPGIPIFSSL